MCGLRDSGARQGAVSQLYTVIVDMANYRLRKGEKLPNDLLVHLKGEFPNKPKTRTKSRRVRPLAEKEVKRFTGWDARCPSGCMALDARNPPTRCYICKAKMERRT